MGKIVMSVKFLLSRRSTMAAAGSLIAVNFSGLASAARENQLGLVPKGKMRTWQLGEQKSFDTLALVERPIPKPGPGQALIKVHYAGIAARDRAITEVGGHHGLCGISGGNQRAFAHRIAAPAGQPGRMRGEAQIEIPMTIAARRPIPHETRSVSANTTGSSCSRLRLESMITRLIQ